MSKTHLRIIKNIHGWALIDNHVGGNGIIATRDTKEEIIKTAKHVYREYPNHYHPVIEINTYDSSFKRSTEVIEIG